MGNSTTKLVNRLNTRIVTDLDDTSLKHLQTAIFQERLNWEDCNTDKILHIFVTAIKKGNSYQRKTVSELLAVMLYRLANEPNENTTNRSARSQAILKLHQCDLLSILLQALGDAVFSTPRTTRGSARDSESTLKTRTPSMVSLKAPFLESDSLTGSDLSLRRINHIKRTVDTSTVHLSHSSCCSHLQSPKSRSVSTENYNTLTTSSNNRKMSVSWADVSSKSIQMQQDSPQTTRKSSLNGLQNIAQNNTEANSPCSDVICSHSSTLTQPEKFHCDYKTSGGQSIRSPGGAIEEIIAETELLYLLCEKTEYVDNTQKIWQLRNGPSILRNLVMCPDRSVCTWALKTYEVLVEHPHIRNLLFCKSSRPISTCLSAFSFLSGISIRGPMKDKNATVPDEHLSVWTSSAKADDKLSLSDLHVILDSCIICMKLLEKKRSHSSGDMKKAFLRSRGYLMLFACVRDCARALQLLQISSYSTGDTRDIPCSSKYNLCNGASKIAQGILIHEDEISIKAKYKSLLSSCVLVALRSLPLELNGPRFECTSIEDSDALYGVLLSSAQNVWLCMHSLISILQSTFNTNEKIISPLPSLLQSKGEIQGSCNTTPAFGPLEAILCVRAPNIQYNIIPANSESDLSVNVMPQKTASAEIDLSRSNVDEHRVVLSCTRDFRKSYINETTYWQVLRLLHFFSQCDSPIVHMRMWQGGIAALLSSIAVDQTRSIASLYSTQAQELARSIASLYSTQAQELARSIADAKRRENEPFWKQLSPRAADPSDRSASTAHPETGIASDTCHTGRRQTFASRRLPRLSINDIRRSEVSTGICETVTTPLAQNYDVQSPNRRFFAEEGKVANADTELLLYQAAEDVRGIIPTRLSDDQCEEIKIVFQVALFLARGPRSKILDSAGRDTLISEQPNAALNSNVFEHIPKHLDPLNHRLNACDVVLRVGKHQNLPIASEVLTYTCIQYLGLFREALDAPITHRQADTEAGSSAHTMVSELTLGGSGLYGASPARSRVSSVTTTFSRQSRQSSDVLDVVRSDTNQEPVPPLNHGCDVTRTNTLNSRTLSSRSCGLNADKDPETTQSRFPIDSQDALSHQITSTTVTNFMASPNIIENSTRVNTLQKTPHRPQNADSVGSINKSSRFRRLRIRTQMNTEQSAPEDAQRPRLRPVRSFMSTKKSSNTQNSVNAFHTALSTVLDAQEWEFNSSMISKDCDTRLASGFLSPQSSAISGGSLIEDGRLLHTKYSFALQRRMSQTSTVRVMSSKPTPRHSIVYSRPSDTDTISPRYQTANASDESSDETPVHMSYSHFNFALRSTTQNALILTVELVKNTVRPWFLVFLARMATSAQPADLVLIDSYLLRYADIGVLPTKREIQDQLRLTAPRIARTRVSLTSTEHEHYDQVFSDDEFNNSLFSHPGSNVRRVHSIPPLLACSEDDSSSVGDSSIVSKGTNGYIMHHNNVTHPNKDQLVGGLVLCDLLMRILSSLKLPTHLIEGSAFLLHRLTQVRIVADAVIRLGFLHIDVLLPQIQSQFVSLDTRCHILHVMRVLAARVPSVCDRILLDNNCRDVFIRTLQEAKLTCNGNANGALVISLLTICIEGATSKCVLLKANEFLISIVRVVLNVTNADTFTHNHLNIRSLVVKSFFKALDNISGSDTPFQKSLELAHVQAMQGYINSTRNSGTGASRETPWSPRVRRLPGANGSDEHRSRAIIASTSSSTLQAACTATGEYTTGILDTKISYTDRSPIAMKSPRSNRNHSGDDSVRSLPVSQPKRFGSRKLVRKQPYDSKQLHDLAEDVTTRGTTPPSTVAQSFPRTLTRVLNDGISDMSIDPHSMRCSNGLAQALSSSSKLTSSIAQASRTSYLDTDAASTELYEKYLDTPNVNRPISHNSEPSCYAPISSRESSTFTNAIKGEKHCVNDSPRLRNEDVELDHGSEKRDAKTISNGKPDREYVTLPSLWRRTSFTHTESSTHTRSPASSHTYSQHFDDTQKKTVSVKATKGNVNQKKRPTHKQNDVKKNEVSTTAATIPSINTDGSDISQVSLPSLISPTAAVVATASSRTQGSSLEYWKKKLDALSPCTSHSLPEDVRTLLHDTDPSTLDTFRRDQVGL